MSRSNDTRCGFAVSRMKLEHDSAFVVLIVVTGGIMGPSKLVRSVDCCHGITIKSTGPHTQTNLSCRS